MMMWVKKLRHILPQNYPSLPHNYPSLPHNYPSLTHIDPHSLAKVKSPLKIQTSNITRTFFTNNRPTTLHSQVKALTTTHKMCRALDSTSYYQGIQGLNNIKVNLLTRPCELFRLAPVCPGNMPRFAPVCPSLPRKYGPVCPGCPGCPENLPRLSRKLLNMT